MVGILGRVAGQDGVGDDQFLEHRLIDARDRAARKHAMRDIGGDRLGARVHQRLGRVAQGAARIDDIVHQHAIAALDLADDVHHFRFAGALAALVDDGKRRVVEPLGQRAGADHAAHVGRDHHQVVVAIARLDIRGDDGRGVEIVGGNVEEALDLPGVQIHREHARRARFGDEVRHKLSRDRCARAGLSVLPTVAEIGDDGGDPAGRGALQRIDADQQFHEVVVDREAGRLDEEDILAAHVLMDLDEDFLVSEAAYAGIGQRQFEIAGDRAGQRQIGVAGHDLHRWRPPCALLCVGIDPSTPLGRCHINATLGTVPKGD